MMRLNVNVPLHYLLWPWRRNPVLANVSDRIRLDRAAWLFIFIVLFAGAVEAWSLMEFHKSFDIRMYPDFERSDGQPYHTDEMVRSFSFARFAIYEALLPLLLIALVNHRASVYARNRRFMPLLLTDLSARQVGETLLAADVMALTLLFLIQGAFVCAWIHTMDMTALLIPSTIIQMALNILTLHAMAWMTLAFASETRFFPKIAWYSFGQGIILFVWFLMIAGLCMGFYTVWKAALHPYNGDPTMTQVMDNGPYLAMFILFPLLWGLTKWGMARVYRRKFVERVEDDPECLPG